MGLCNLCLTKIEPVPAVSDKSNETIDAKNGVSINEMLSIFKYLPKFIAGNSSISACCTCFTELTVCFKFYGKLLNASRIVNQTPKAELQQYRKIAPKPSNNPTVSDKHISKVLAKRRYRCEECSSEFTSYRQLRSHHATHQVENVCQYCALFFFENTAVDVHLKERHANRKYKCSKCGKELPSRNLLFKHLKAIHQSSDQEYRCNECRGSLKIFQNRRAMEKHIKTVHPDYRGKPDIIDQNQDDDEDREPDMIEEFLDDMDEEFLDEFLLNQDQNSFCWDDFSLTHFDEDFQALTPRPEIKQNGRYKCPQCCESFQTQQFLIKHLAHTHDEFVLICNSCGNSFNRYSKLKQHCSTHASKGSISSGYKSLSSLQCTECNRKYTTLAGLKYHLKVHSAAKPFTCPYCQKAFTASTNLNAHIRNIHAETKPNICTLCDRKFASLDHLKKHVMSVHQKERNHLCSVCGKSFSQASHLRQHSLIHSGVRPHQCDGCGAGFFKKIELRRHLEKCLEVKISKPKNTTDAECETNSVLRTKKCQSDLC